MSWPGRWAGFGQMRKVGWGECQAEGWGEDRHRVGKHGMSKEWKQSRWLFRDRWEKPVLRRTFMPGGGPDAVGRQ